MNREEKIKNFLDENRLSHAWLVDTLINTGENMDKATLSRILSGKYVGKKGERTLSKSETIARLYDNYKHELAETFKS